MFWSKNKEKKLYACKPMFYNTQVGYEGVYITWTCFPDVRIQNGFSASGNTVLSETHIVQFYSAKTNYGSGYSSSTRKFTCSHPGLYYFSVSLIKERDYYNIVDSVVCIIYENTVALISTKFNIIAKLGFTGVYIHVVNNYPVTKNKPIYQARNSKQMKWRAFREPFHLFTVRA